MSGDSATVGSLMHLRNRLCTKIWCVARFKKYSINILNCLLLIWRCLLRALKRFLRLGTINHLIRPWALRSCQSTPDTIHSFIYDSLLFLFCTFVLHFPCHFLSLSFFTGNVHSHSLSTFWLCVLSSEEGAVQTCMSASSYTCRQKESQRKYLGP